MLCSEGGCRRMVAGARGLLCLVLACHSASVQSFLFSIPSSAFPLWRTSSRSASAAAWVQRPQDVPALRRSRMPTGSIYGNNFFSHVCACALLLDAHVAFCRSRQTCVCTTPWGPLQDACVRACECVHVIACDACVFACARVNSCSELQEGG